MLLCSISFRSIFQYLANRYELLSQYYVLPPITIAIIDVHKVISEHCFKPDSYLLRATANDYDSPLTNQY